MQVNREIMYPFNDFRFQKLQVGLNQLSNSQLCKLLTTREKMVFEDWNFNPHTKKY